MANRRAKLPLEVRRRIQRWVRNFVFFGVTYMTLWHAFCHLHEFYTVGNTMKRFGFVSGVLP